MGRTTLRSVLVGAGLESPRRRRPPKHRVRRQRMPREGKLIQLDGNHHRWLGDERPPFALLQAVDDATGCSNAPFCEQEDSHSYFQLIQGLLHRRGIPRPYTPTATRSSSTDLNISSLGRPPSSDGPWQSWALK